MVKKSRFLFVLSLAVHLIVLSGQAQDFGTVGSEKGEEKITPENEFTDTYRLTLRVRPLSYLLFPITSGNMGSFNGRVDYAFSRNVSIGLEANYFFTDTWPAANIFSSTDLISLRIDANYFIFRKSNPEKYAEGFHLGPYMKLKSEETRGPDVVSTYGIQSIYGGSLIFGGIIGFQYVNKRFVIDQHIGGGIGLASYNIGSAIALDFRLGLSIGTVLLK